MPLRGFLARLPFFKKPARRFSFRSNSGKTPWVKKFHFEYSLWVSVHEGISPLCRTSPSIATLQRKKNKNLVLVGLEPFPILYWDNDFNTRQERRGCYLFFPILKRCIDLPFPSLGVENKTIPLYKPTRTRFPPPPDRFFKKNTQPL